jgi:hypothetical protein
MTKRDENAERLVRQCLSSDKARTQLYLQYACCVLALVRRQLGRQSTDADVEDMAQGVWCSLFEKSCRRLRSYDPTRGRLSTFLRALVRAEIQRFKRERARHSPSRPFVPLSAELADTEISLTRLQAALDDFLVTLTRQERNFCCNQLLKGAAKAGPQPFSAVNRRQLKHRVGCKLRTYIRDC